VIPDWVTKILQELGLAGVVIFFLLLAVAGLVAYVKSLHTKADKVYGFRLAERDSLNKALTDTAKVLEDVLEASEERNALTEQQAELITKQAQAFELLKVTILSQYDNIRDHNTASASAVASMAEAIRTLSSMVIENRSIAQGHVLSVNASLNDLKTELVGTLRDERDQIVKAVQGASDNQIKELQRLLGTVTRIEHRRKRPQ